MTASIPVRSVEPLVAGKVSSIAQRIRAWLHQRRGVVVDDLRSGEDVDARTQGLARARRGADFDDEYRRRAVDRVLAACPYLR